MSKQRSYLPKTLTRGLAVLEFVAAAGTGCTNSEVAAACGLDPASSHRFLRSLVSHGFLYKENGRYYLSCRLYSLGVKARKFLLFAAEPVINELAKKTGFTASLAIMQGRCAYPVLLAPGEARLIINSNLGRPIPLHASALGKSLLAALPPPLRKGAVADLELVALTENTITDPKALLRELELVEKRGFAVDYGETHPGVVCVGMCVSRQMIPLSSISISCPSSLVDKKLLTTELVAELREAVDTVRMRAGLW